MRISDWSSDVCSSDLGEQGPVTLPPADSVKIDKDGSIWIVPTGGDPNLPQQVGRLKLASPVGSNVAKGLDGLFRVVGGGALPSDPLARVNSGSRSEEHTSELPSLMRPSYAVFCLKTK